MPVRFGTIAVPFEQLSYYAGYDYKSTVFYIFFEVYLLLALTTLAAVRTSNSRKNWSIWIYRIVLTYGYVSHIIVGLWI